MGRLRPSSHFLDIPLANGFAPPPSSRHVSSVPPLHLSSREDSTRVQLQKQRLSEQQHAIVVSQKIPGFKTSAGMWNFVIRRTSEENLNDFESRDQDYV
jgi:hypothetical protein